MKLVKKLVALAGAFIVGSLPLAAGPARAQSATPVGGIGPVLAQAQPETPADQQHRKDTRPAVPPKGAQQSQPPQPGLQRSAPQPGPAHSGTSQPGPSHGATPQPGPSHSAT